MFIANKDLKMNMKRNFKENLLNNVCIDPVQNLNCSLCLVKVVTILYFYLIQTSWTNASKKQREKLLELI